VFWKACPPSGAVELSLYCLSVQCKMGTKVMYVRTGQSVP